MKPRSHLSRRSFSAGSLALAACRPKSGPTSATAPKEGRSRCRPRPHRRTKYRRAVLGDRGRGPSLHDEPADLRDDHGVREHGILDPAIDAAIHFTPMTAAEVQALLDRTRDAAMRGEYEKFKTSEYFDSTAKNPQWLETAKI